MMTNTAICIPVGAAVANTTETITLQFNGYAWNEDKDAIDQVVNELIRKRGYYQQYHRGLSCPSAAKLRAEAREIIKTRTALTPPS